MKTISFFLALINTLLAGLFIAASLLGSELHQAVAWWLLIKVSAAASVILIGILTWLGNTRSLSPSLMSLCSLFLVALGTAASVWTFHLALVTGDIEFYMVIYGGSLIIQGLASLLGFAGECSEISPCKFSAFALTAL